mmetsp:Transcript_93093/g.300923  ORF Transcript_93093/g.300923 Transcript_93093/m.300923 type:complete len:668 (+) Transcript_93093:475-2478(+)
MRWLSAWATITDLHRRCSCNHYAVIVRVLAGADWYWKPETAKDAVFSEEDIAVSQFFSEGNGGEMRLSYHGYPKGYAQLIDSPNEFHIMPMQIDTKNRHYSGPGFKPDILPRSATSPPNASYSGILECPCTTRIKKEWWQAHATLSKGTCHDLVENSSECFSAVPSVVKGSTYNTKVVANKSLPSGCVVQAHASGVVDAVWNQDRSANTCGQSAPTKVHSVGFAASKIVSVTVEVSEATSEATITITGPAEVWFGVGLGASSMCLHPQADECPSGGPYAIIVSGSSVTEHKLDQHAPGVQLARSVHVKSIAVQGGERTVVVTRPLKGLTQRHFTFNPKADKLDFISAHGVSLVFAKHNLHDSSTLNFVSVDQLTCICRAGIQGKINGAGFPYPGPCAGQPTGDLAFEHNPTCSVQTYSGGLRCCIHGNYLLDTDQEPPEEYQEYHMKFRFYFEEYVPGPKPSHQNLLRLYWTTEAFAGEYDIVPCLPGTPTQDCIQVITSRWKIRDLLRDCTLRSDSSCTGVGSTDASKTAGVKLIYAGPHCHAPSCLSMELYNADTGRLRSAAKGLICHMEPAVGQSNNTYDEKGFVALPPCLWGSLDEGLLEPELLSLDTELLSIKRNNNTVGHYGEMASWQMRGILVPRAEDAGQAEQAAALAPSKRRWAELMV